MLFCWISFQWRIWRGTTAAQSGPTWCPRASAKSWRRRTRRSRRSRENCKSLIGGETVDCGSVERKQTRTYCHQEPTGDNQQCHTVLYILLVPNVSFPRVSYGSDTQFRALWVLKCLFWTQITSKHILFCCKWFFLSRKQPNLSMFLYLIFVPYMKVSFNLLKLFIILSLCDLYYIWIHI